MKEKAYYENVNVKNEVKLRHLLEELPPFCRQFFIGIEPTTSSRTRIAYAYDIGCFFDYLHTQNPICQKMKFGNFRFPSWIKLRLWILKNIFPI